MREYIKSGGIESTWGVLGGKGSKHYPNVLYEILKTFIKNELLEMQEVYIDVNLLKKHK